MVIDILILIVACASLFYGWRKGAIVLFLQLMGIYLASLLATDYADNVGSIFTDDPGLSYFVGYLVIIVGVWALIWIIAPLIHKLLVFKALRKFDSLIGMFFSFLTTIVIVSVMLSLFETANVGQVRADKLLELGGSGLTMEEIKVYADKIENKDRSLQEFFEPKYVEYETLEESAFFYPLADFGAGICPGLKDVQHQILEWALKTATEYDGE